ALNKRGITCTSVALAASLGAEAEIVCSSAQIAAASAAALAAGGASVPIVSGIGASLFMTTKPLVIAGLIVAAAAISLTAFRFARINKMPPPVPEIPRAKPATPSRVAEPAASSSQNPQLVDTPPGQGPASETGIGANVPAAKLLERDVTSSALVHQ